jgi:hypothetical protein
MLLRCVVLRCPEVMAADARLPPCSPTCGGERAAERRPPQESRWLSQDAEQQPGHGSPLQQQSRHAATRPHDSTTTPEASLSPLRHSHPLASSHSTCLLHPCSTASPARLGPSSRLLLRSIINMPGMHYSSASAWRILRRVSDIDQLHLDRTAVSPPARNSWLCRCTPSHSTTGT